MPAEGSPDRRDRQGRNLFIASDVNAITHCSPYRTVIYLNDNEVVHLSDEDFSITTASSKDVEPVIQQVDWDTSEAELGDYSHFMEKEIFEQPAALENAMRGRSPTMAAPHSSAV